MKIGLFKNKQNIIVFLIIISFSIIIRMTFRTGMVLDENFENFRIAREISFAINNFQVHHQFKELTREILLIITSVGGRKALFCLPFGFLFSFLGTKEYIIIFSQILFVISTILVLYRIGKRFGGSFVGYICILIWSFLPEDVYLSTTFLKSEVTFFFQILFILLFIEGLDELKFRINKILGAFCCIVISFMLDLSSIVFIIGAFYYYLYNKLRVDKKIIISLLVFSWIIMGFYIANMLKLTPNFNLGELGQNILLNNSNVILFFPILLYCSYQIIKKNKQDEIVSVVLFIYLFTFFAHFYNYKFNNYINITNIILPIYFSATLVVSIYFGKVLKASSFKIVLPWLLLLLVLTSLWLINSKFNLLSPISSTLDYPWVIDNPLLILLELLPGLSILIILLYRYINKFYGTNLFLTSTNYLIILVLLIFSQYNTILSRSIASISLRENPRMIKTYLEKAQVPLPVLIDDQLFYSALDFYFEADDNSSVNYPNQLISYKSIDFHDPIPKSSYIVLSNIHDGNIPSEWFLEKVIESSGAQPVYLYRFIQKEDQNTFKDLDIQANNDDYWAYGININRGNFCDGYENWVHYTESSSDKLFIIPIYKEDCFQLDKSIDLITANSWNTLWGSGKLNYHDDQISFEKRYYFGNETYYQNIPIEEDTYYLYSLDIKINERIILPFLIINGEENYLYSSQRFPDWTHLVFLIKTPSSISEVPQMRLFPYLTYGNHLRTKTSQIKNIHLYKVIRE